MNNDEDNASTAVKIKDAPGVGYTLYVTHMTVSSRLVDISIRLLNGDTVAGDTDELFGPFGLQANGNSTCQKDFKYPLKLTSNTGLYVYNFGNPTAFTVYVEGFTGKDEI